MLAVPPLLNPLGDVDNCNMVSAVTRKQHTGLTLNTEATASPTTDESNQCTASELLFVQSAGGLTSSDMELEDPVSSPDSHVAEYVHLRHSCIQSHRSTSQAMDTSDEDQELSDEDQESSDEEDDRHMPYYTCLNRFDARMSLIDSGACFDSEMLGADDVSTQAQWKERADLFAGAMSPRRELQVSSKTRALSEACTMLVSYCTLPPTPVRRELFFKGLTLEDDLGVSISTTYNQMMHGCVDRSAEEMLNSITRSGGGEVSVDIARVLDLELSRPCIPGWDFISRPSSTTPQKREAGSDIADRCSKRRNTTAWGRTGLASPGTMASVPEPVPSEEHQPSEDEMLEILRRPLKAMQATQGAVPLESTQPQNGLFPELHGDKRYWALCRYHHQHSAQLKFLSDAKSVTDGNPASRWALVLSQEIEREEANLAGISVSMMTMGYPLLKIQADEPTVVVV